jgi:hypothetical protein
MFKKFLFSTPEFTNVSINSEQFPAPTFHTMTSQIIARCHSLQLNEVCTTSVNYPAPAAVIRTPPVGGNQLLIFLNGQPV